MRGRFLAAALGVLALAGCGSDDAEVPEFTGSDEEQIAATVNALIDAIEAEDGEAMCALLSERGQQLFLKTAREAPQGSEVEGCAEALPILREQGFDPEGLRG